MLVKLYACTKIYSAGVYGVKTANEMIQQQQRTPEYSKTYFFNILSHDTNNHKIAPKSSSIRDFHEKFIYKTFLIS